jgi:ribosomal protein L37E
VKWRCPRCGAKAFSSLSGRWTEEQLKELESKCWLCGFPMEQVASEASQDAPGATISGEEVSA